MKANELLDGIIELFQKMPHNAKISEQMAAHQKAIKLIEDALIKEYEKGCVDTSTKIHQLETEKKMKNN